MFGVFMFGGEFDVFVIRVVLRWLYVGVLLRVVFVVVVEMVWMFFFYEFVLLMVRWGCVEGFVFELWLVMYEV